MSASLYHDCIDPFNMDYEYIPNTTYENGDIKFKDIKAGDTLYFCDDLAILELEVIKPLYDTKGHKYLKYKIKGKSKERTINFGPLNDADVINVGEMSSVLWTIIYDGIISTSREAVKRECIKTYEEKINDLESKIEQHKSTIDNINSL